MVFCLQRLDTSCSLFQVDLLLVPCLAYFAVAIIMKVLFMCSFTSICSALIKQIMAVLQDLVLLYHFMILAALKFGERVCVFSLICRALQLSLVLLTLCSLGFDEFLLFKNDHLKRPTALHPSLQMLLNFLISHLPALYFLSNTSCLPLNSFHLNGNGVRLSF